MTKVTYRKEKKMTQNEAKTIIEPKRKVGETPYMGEPLECAPLPPTSWGWHCADPDWQGVWHNPVMPPWTVGEQKCYP